MDLLNRYTKWISVIIVGSFISLMVTQIYLLKRSYDLEHDRFMDNLDELVFDAHWSTLDTAKMALADTSFVDYDSLLRTSLEKEQFNLEFVLGVQDLTDRSWRYISASADTAELKEASIVSTLGWQHEGEFLFAQNLYFVFDNKHKIILSRIISSILVSSGLVLLTFLIYFWLVKLIRRQKKLSEMRNDFINNMTHELNTPIANIFLAVDNINSPKVLTNQQAVKNFTSVIRKENARLELIVDQVLNTVKQTKNGISNTLQEVDVHSIVEDLQEIWKDRLSKLDGNLILKLEATKSSVEADPLHLLNAFSNLVDNAIKYNDRKPRIEIRTFNKEANLSVIIEDNGRGIPKADQPFIFEKFYRVSAGNLHKVKGFGLGLSYVKSVIDSISGTIKLLSSQSQTGSSFQIQFNMKEVHGKK